MLITSRATRRWVIPKGNPIKGLKPHEAAAQEAFEEAGLIGITSPTSIGSYDYLKQRRQGEARQAIVDVFPLSVTEQMSEWPEQHQRECRWFSLADAAQAVAEPDLKTIISRFQPPALDPHLVTLGVPATRLYSAATVFLTRCLRALMRH